jgi:hypothetical protein
MAFTQLPTGGGVPNVDLITQTLAKLQPDSALQNYARMHKNDPYILSLATAESNRRKALRLAAQGQNAGPQPTVADQSIAGMAPAPVMTGSGGTLQTGYGGPVMTGMASGGLPEDQGIAQLPTPNMQRMADGGIAGYEDDEEGMATGGMGGMFNFAQQSEPVVRMSGGGVPGYAAGVWNNSRFLEYLKQNGLTAKFAKGSEDEKKAILDAFGDKTSGPQKPAAQAASTTAASTAAPTKEGALYKPAKAAGEAVKYGKGALKGIPYVSGAVGAYQGVSDLKDAGGFYNDPNVSTFEKAKQAGLTTVKAGLPIAGAGIGSLFTPAGTFVGGLAGTAASEYLDLETDALKAWKKANPQATPDQTKKAAVALAPAYDGPKLNAAQAERATTGQPTITAVPEAKPDPTVGGVKDLLPAVNAAPSKAPTIEDATALGDKFLNSKSRIADINRQVLQEQVDANRAKENSIEALAAFNKKQGPAYAGYEESLKKEELQDATDKEKAGLMALFKGFLGVAAGESPNAAVNFAKGSMLGLDDYSGAMKEFKKSAKERNKEMQFIGQARRAEERGDYDKVQMYEDKAIAANQASARFGIAAVNDITNAGGKISSDIYNTILSNTSRENIAAMGERGATARANAQLKAPSSQMQLFSALGNGNIEKGLGVYANVMGPEAKGDQAIIAKYSGPQGQIALQMLETQGPEGKAQAELIRQIIKQNTGSMLRPQEGAGSRG